MKLKDSYPNPLPEHLIVDGKAYILESNVALINNLSAFMRAVIYGEETYYYEAMNRSGKLTKYVSKLGKELTSLRAYASLYASGFQYHPLIIFFFEQYRSHDIRNCHGSHALMRGPNGLEYSQIFDDFVSTMRAAAKSENLKKRVLDWESKTGKNFQRALKLVERLFQSHARLMVVRLDLHHNAAQFQLGELQAYLDAAAVKQVRDASAFEAYGDISSFVPLQGRVAFETVQKDREHFFANMKGKPSLFEHLVGYVWRIEFSTGAGYHLHVVLFFDGSKVHKHAWLANQIGDWWGKEITEGRGYFHNVNAEWLESNPNCGIGMIDHHDHAKRKNLEMRVLAYLCKSSQIVQVLPYVGANTFGSSELPKLPMGLGRPRIKGCDAGNHQHRLSDFSYPTSSFSLQNKGLRNSLVTRAGGCNHGGGVIGEGDEG